MLTEGGYDLNCPLLRLGFLVGLISLILPSQVLALSQEKIKELRTQAESFERKSQWDKACILYGEILQHRRHFTGIRNRYKNCLRRYFQVLRHQDPSYQQEVLTLKISRALRLFEFVQINLTDNSIDKHKATPERMFRKGLEEFRYALSNPEFIRKHLRGVHSRKIRQFRSSLNRIWANRSIYSVQNSANTVREVAISALKQLRLKPTTVVMEFTCGSCYAIDDYTMYLTPTELRDLCDSFKGEIGDVGVQLSDETGVLLISGLIAGSSAAQADPPLFLDDQLISIDGKSVDNYSAAMANELLQGTPGTIVEMVVQSPEMGTRMVKLRRERVFVPSVYYHFKQGPIGYLSITTFQESTFQEVEEALLALEKLQMKVLIVDLRDNRGGMIGPSVSIARRFLANGVIVSTQNLDPKEDAIFHSHNPAASTIPLILLVNGDTASAAEILAGALKENKRARLVGQTTYGKGCIQEILRLTPSPNLVFPGGLRVTVSRFHSPKGSPYSGRGITPHIYVDPDLDAPSLASSDPQLEAALVEAQKLLDILQ